MAISLPVSIASVPINPMDFTRGRPILSGSAANDQALGWRGLVNILNHAYAYRVGAIAQFSPPYADTLSSFSQAAAGALYVTAQYLEPAKREGIRRWILACDIAEGYGSANTSLGNFTTASTAARAWVIGTLATPDARSLPTVRIAINRRTTGVTALLYRWVLLEDLMTSGEIT